ncbi:SRPBCC family protein [Dyadobacter tibetensis]|uniref:SRPBCC family protein n=1 Tax=Dyadobacter tibetensis TaxID=1211851 RepID=UPI0004718AED|nr:SRPBCC family protein [Dyadobacter tibetensis]
MSNSITLHRILTSPQEKTFRAFSNTEAFCSWLPPYGFICIAHHREFRVGGSFKMSFLNFSTEKTQSFGGDFLEIMPNELIRYRDRFDDPTLTGEMLTTIKFSKVSCGTELHIVQEGIPAMIPVEMCYLGWQESLEKLKKLVEPIIPDA